MVVPCPGHGRRLGHISHAALAPSHRSGAFSARLAGRDKSAFVKHARRCHKFARSRCVHTTALFDKKKAATTDEAPQLASAKLGPEVDTDELLNMLRNWAYSFSSSGVQTLTLALQVDSIEDGVRMALIEVKDGKINPLVWYDLTIKSVPEVKEGKVFLAVRDGPYRQLTPPNDEGLIFMQLQGFLKAAIVQCTA
eukprot:CAMPEP_0118933692 /NCGR_PEP_ID=MMETSP1169-20130426/12165_1 /TAXON_ID=36882 /ORGANISM="Pyramimonas obovata, Strain CCMP722" /LENGTH=194 /DNA_ID=CAMNT_0006876487 /DNA_START=106 /DNA_END=690 /DNA_ORIENTATION=+